MKIAILTLGTRGDVQPYAVLGQALQAHGHEVTLSTAKNFEPLVTSYGLGFWPVEADFQAVLDSEEGKKMMKGNPFAILKHLHTWIYPLITDSLTEFYTLAQQSDLVLYHVKTLADSFADQFPEKMIRASVLPIVEPTSEFANPALSGLPIPKWLNRLSYTLANQSIGLLSKPIGAFRTKFGLSKRFKVPTVRNIYGLSAHFLPKPTDYPSNSQFLGFWFGVSKRELSDKLLNFLQSGEPPLLITFGSMPYKCKMDIQNAILKLATQLDARVIVVKGWGLAQTERLEGASNIMVMDEAPYEKLFPLVKAVIHHGGIGTTSECLRAGKPFMVCPILYPMGDQQFWGQWSHKQGLAVKPIPIKKLNETTFINSVHELLTDTSLYERAEATMQLLKQEDGLTSTIKAIEQYAVTTK